MRWYDSARAVAVQYRYQYNTDMTSLHVRHIKPSTLEALKRMAKVHHRSLQGELHAILERAAQLAPSEDKTKSLDLVTVRTGYTGSWSRDEIYDAEGR